MLSNASAKAWTARDAPQMFLPVHPSRTKTSPMKFYQENNSLKTIPVAKDSSVVVKIPPERDIMGLMKRIRESEQSRDRT